MSAPSTEYCQWLCQRISRRAKNTTVNAMAAAMAPHDQRGSKSKGTNSNSHPAMPHAAINLREDSINALGARVE